MNCMSYGARLSSEEIRPLVSGDPEQYNTSSGETCTPLHRRTLPWVNVCQAILLLSLLYLAAQSNQILRELRTSNAMRSHPVTSRQPSWTTAAMVNLQDIVQEPQSTPTTSWTPHFLVVYIPDDNGQLAMATNVAKGIKSVLGNAMVEVQGVDHATFQNVLWADSIVLGSSVENGNTHPLLQSWIDQHWDIGEESLSRKIGAAFVTAGGLSAGQESTLQSLLRAMLIFRMIVVGGLDWTEALGAAAITGEEPFGHWREGSDLDFDPQCYTKAGDVLHPVFQEKAFGLGVRVATVTSQFHSPKD